MAQQPLKIVENSEKQLPCNIEAEQAVIASILVSNAVLSTFFPFIELPELISIETKASVGLITKYPPDFSLISESNI